MLALPSRRKAHRIPHGGAISWKTRGFELVVAAIGISLLIAAVVRTFLRERNSVLSWSKETDHIELPIYVSTSDYGQVLPRQPFIVTGARTGFREVTSWRPSRLEISEFEQNGPAFDLYLQCQNQIMARSQQDVLSYYQIAGIHMKPFKPWNGIYYAGVIDAGYAPHGSVIFPVWHRPYVTMFEQLVCECAVSLAAKYPPLLRPLYHQEAVALRLPYWDWAKDATMPEITNRPTYTVRTPHGIERISNPLYRYVFHPVPGTASSPDKSFVVGNFTGLPYTVRSIDGNGVTNISTANHLLRTKGNFMEITHSLLTKLNGSYAHFSNKHASEASSSHKEINIENIHNHVHGLIGGHMGTQYAAFDPIFWLHHVNIDRIFAIWQAIYPDSYVVPQINLNGTMSTAPGTIEDVDSPLIPFASHKSGTLHTAQTVRNTHDLGYGYAELNHLELTPTELSNKVLEIVENLYGNRSLWVK